MTIFRFLNLQQFTWIDLIDLIIVTIIIYGLYQLIRGTRAFQMILGITFLFLAWKFANTLHLKTSHRILGAMLVYIPFAIIVIFQSTIRKALGNFGVNPLRFFQATTSSNTLDEVVLAAMTMASEKVGGIIIIERELSLKSYADNGILLDAHVTYDMLLNIFAPKTPLHDGAVIIQGDRISAASCFLPLTLDPHLSKQFGTRHRAAIGITEETDALVIVVSEERGIVSFVENGKIVENVEGEALKSLLMARLVE